MADPKKAIEDFNTNLDDINQRIIDVGGSIGENLIEKFTQAVIEARKIKDPLSEVSSISKKISDIAEENTILQNKLASLSLDYSKAVREGNEEEVKKLLAKKNQLKDTLNLNEALQKEYKTLVDVANQQQKNTKEQKEQNKLLDFAKGKINDFVDDYKKLFTLAGVYKMIADGVTRANEASVNFSKTLGYNAAHAYDVNMAMQGIALSSGNTNVTFKNMVEASNALATTTGYVMDYNKMSSEKARDILETQIMLTKQMGLTGEEAAHIYEMSVLTGKSSAQTNDEMLSAFVNARNATRAGVNMKQTFSEASKVSGRLQANLGGSAANIVNAVVRAKALGTTLEQTARQGDKLLEFESSIESELKAELLTGKQLNLERARAAALAGDQVTLAEELNKNIGSYDDFTKMNVLQQKALADSVGLTSDELAEQLKKQKLAEESGKSLEQINKEEAEAAEKRKTIQEKFNNIMEKLLDIVGSIGTAIEPFVAAITWVLDQSWIVYTVLGVMLISKLPAIAAGFGGIVSKVRDLAGGIKGAFSMDGIKGWFSKVKEGFMGVKSQFAGGSFSKGKELLAKKQAAEAAKQAAGGGIEDTAKKAAGAGEKTGVGGAKAGQGIKDTLTGISKGIQSFSKVSPADIGKLMLSALALVLLTPAIPALLLLQLVNGKLIQGALTGIGKGLAAMGKSMAAAAPELLIAELLLAGLGLALWTFVPIVEAFGKVITAVFSGLADVIKAGADGISTIFSSLQNVDVVKLLAVGPALTMIGIGLASLGAGGVISAIGSFLGGDPIKKIEALAAAGTGLQMAAIGMQGIALALMQVSIALASIDTDKLEALSDFSARMSVGSAVKGITDLITAPIKATGNIAGGGKAENQGNAEMVKAINEVRDAVSKVYNKEMAIYLDSTILGTTIAKNSYLPA